MILQNLCERMRVHASTMGASTNSTKSNIETFNASQSDENAEMLYQRPADELIFFETDGSQPSTIMPRDAVKRIFGESCQLQKPQDHNSTRPKGRVAFLFRGESFRNDAEQLSRSRCCKAGAIAQRVLFESHKKMFNEIVADGYQGVDVFGTTYR